MPGILKQLKQAKTEIAWKALLPPRVSCLLLQLLLEVVVVHVS